MKATGKVLVIGKVEEIGSAGFKKRELVLEIAENPQYPQKVKFEFHKDNCDKLNVIGLGDKVELDFNLNGREWVNTAGETVYFNTLVGWKIAVNEKAPEAQNNIAPAGEEDDLPF